MNGQAIAQLLDASIDTEELVRTSSLASLRSIAASENKATSTLRAALAFLNANVATGNAQAKASTLRKRVHILRAVATIGEVGSMFISPDLAHDIARMAVEELLASNEKIAGWELSATHVLVSLCPLHMNLVLGELVERMKPGSPPNMSILYALESVASSASEAFVGGMARVASRIVPMLGSIKNWRLQVQIAAAFSAFCDAVNTTPGDVPSDISIAVNSVCDVFLSTWLLSGRGQVRGATARALGAMSKSMDRERMYNIGPELMKNLLTLLRREDPSSDSRVDLAMGLHGVMDSGVVGQLESTGQDLESVLTLLHPLVAVPPDYTRPNFNRARTELLRCVELLTTHHARNVIEKLVSNMASSSGETRTGTIMVMTHLINSCSDSIEESGMKESVLSGTIRLLNETDIDVRAAIAQLIVALGSANFLTRDSGRELVLFVVKQCRVSRDEISAYNKKKSGGWFGSGSGGNVSPTQLGRACERFVSALGQCATPSVWPLLFATLTDVQYGGQSVDAVCKCLVDVATGKSLGGEKVGDGGERKAVEEIVKKTTQTMPSVNFDGNPDLPSSHELFARLIVSAIYSTEKLQRQHAGDNHLEKQREQKEQQTVEVPSSLLLLSTVGQTLHSVVGESFHTKMMGSTGREVGSSTTTVPLDMLPNVYTLFCNIGKIATIRDGSWWNSVGNSLSHLSSSLFCNNSPLKSICYRCLGAVLSTVTSTDLPRKWTANMLKMVDHTDYIQRNGLGRAIEASATPPSGAVSRHIDIILQCLANVLRDECVVVKSGWFGSTDGDRTESQVRQTKATLLICWGHAALGTSAEALSRHLDAQFVGPMSDILNSIKNNSSVESHSLRSAFLHGATCLGQALNRKNTKIANGTNSAPSSKLTTRDEWLNMCCDWMQRFADDDSEGSSSGSTTTSNNNTRKRSPGTRVTRVALLKLMSELVQMTPFPSNDLRKRIVGVCLPILSDSEERDNEIDEMKDVIEPVATFLSSMLQTQQKEAVRFKLFKSFIFSQNDDVRLSNLISCPDEKVRRRALHAMSMLLNLHMKLFDNSSQHGTMAALYALVVPRVVDRHLSVQNIATSIVHRIVTNASKLKKDETFFTTNEMGQSIGTVLEAPSATQERLTCLRRLCAVFCPLMEEWKDIEQYAKVFISALNDDDPAAASSASECLLHLIDTRGKEFEQLVQLLVTTTTASTADIVQKDAGEKKTAASNSNNKLSKKQREEQIQLKEEEKKKRVLYPTCLMDGFYAMNERDRKTVSNDADQKHVSIQSAVLRQRARTMLTFAVRSLAHQHFTQSLDVLLSTTLPISSEILTSFVGLVCPPSSPRALDDEALPASCAEPMLQSVVQRCIVLLHSAPTGTKETPNSILSATHQVLQSMLAAPSSTMTSFVNEYFSHLICGIVLSIVSLATSLGDNPFVADAMTTCDILLRRAGRSELCSDLENIHQKITNIDVPVMLSKVILETTCSTTKKQIAVLQTMSNFNNSNDVGQRRTAVSVVSAIVALMDDGGDSSGACETTEHTKKMTELLLSKSMDSDNGVVRHSLLGLGQVAKYWTKNTFEQHAPGILNTTVGLMDAQDSVVADAALESLCIIIKHARSGIVAPLLLNICFRLHGALTHPSTISSTLICCFRLLENIGRFGVEHVQEKDMRTQLEEQMHRMLPLVVVQLRSSSFEVSVCLFHLLDLFPQLV